MATLSKPAGDRIATLDIVRGVAVMGILAMNIVSFAMPAAAYNNPVAYGGDTGADFVSWAFNFILIDGRMRGLFSLLFGASLMLVIARAEASGRSPARVHYARMMWLLVFGLLHYVLLWQGDILALYASVGMLAFLLRGNGVRSLCTWAAGLLVVQFALFALFTILAYLAQAAALAPDASADAVALWAEMQAGLGATSGAETTAEIGLKLGGYGTLATYQLQNVLPDLATVIALFGWETLAYFLLGMAAFKSGFLTGAWADSSYRRVALAGFGIGIPVYAACAIAVTVANHDVPTMFLFEFTATIPVRVLMIGATAALIILLTRRGGALIDRIAAAGRMAFTNYLATSIAMTFLFYGWGIGLFGSLSRAQLWLPVVLMWALMLLWSKPWLDRFRYGPMEWAWRSLARGRIETLRRP